MAPTGVVSAAFALEPPPPAQPQDQLTLSGQLELARLVDIAASRLGLTVEYDPAALRGTVALRSGPIADSELWPLVNRLLAGRGFTTVRLPGSEAFSVVRIQDAAALARLEPEEEIGARPGFQTLVLRARHRPARELVEAAKAVLSRAGSTATELGPASGGLYILADTSARLEQAARVIELLDQPGEAALVEVAASHLAAPQLVAAVTQLATRREAVSGQRVPGEVLAAPSGRSVFIVAPPANAAYWRELIVTLDRREEVLTRTYTPRHFAPRDVARLIEETLRVGRPGGGGGAAQGGAVGDDRLRVVTDELTGSLIVTATPEVHGQIEELVARLDSVPAAARRPVRAFKIRNRGVSEMMTVLDRLVAAGALDGPGEGDRIAGLAMPATPPDPQRSERPVPRAEGMGGTGGAGGQPVPDSAPSSPLSPPPAAETAAAQPRTQPATPTAAGTRPVRELTLTADEGTNTLIAIGEPRLLAQLADLIAALDVRQPQVMLEVLIISLSESQSLSLGTELRASLDLSGDAQAELASLFGLGSAPTAGPVPAISGGGFTGLVLSPGDWSVLVRALETLTKGRSLNIPRVLVNNNESASLTSVLQQPFASINASTTATTTSFGGTQDAGTTVNLVPQIAEGDYLVLKYDVSLSAFAGLSPGQGLPPPRQQNRISSAVSIPDGHTVILGGLDVTGDDRGTGQIPFIGDIPLLGELFKNRNNSSSRQRFYVFVRPSIMRQADFAGLKYLSGRAAADAKIDDGWPTVRPRVIR